MTYRFGTFEFDPGAGQLWKAGRRVRLEPQPARLLAVLLSRAGEVVPRDDLKRQVWIDGTHVDFDRGLAFCLAQVRSALGDSAENPRFIETLPRRGVRFIAPVAVPEVASAAGGVASPSILRFGGNRARDASDLRRPRPGSAGDRGHSRDRTSDSVG